jgi:diguanylate cyclase (GGDEF)-like protein
VNPLTQLPGNVQVQEEVAKRVAQALPFALMYIDLDNFKAFNDYYGFLRGDETIKLLARTISDTFDHLAPDKTFIGHIGGDDFVAITDPSISESAAQAIIQAWDRDVISLYDPDDAERGWIEIEDRRGDRVRFPVMSVSVGVATNARRPIESHWEAAEIATEMKQFAKQEPNSGYAIDRRRAADEPHS